jgi:hypothetical protein
MHNLFAQKIFKVLSTAEEFRLAESPKVVIIKSAPEIARFLTLWQRSQCICTLTENKEDVCCKFVSKLVRSHESVSGADYVKQWEKSDSVIIIVNCIYISN